MKNKYSKIILLFLIVILGVKESKADGSLFSQYVITPTATDLGKVADIPVSYYTGQANVSVPIYSTEQLSIPLQIQLNYDGSGYLVNKLPGWTGHNWTLSAGGVITRVENGQADEWMPPVNYNSSLHYKKGFMHTYPDLNEYWNKYWKEDNKDNLTSISNPNENSLVQNLFCGDFQPDIFYFNFCGISGRFFLGNDGEWKVLSENNIKVEFDFREDFIPPFIPNFPNTTDFNQPLTIKGFTLIDENGTRYTFGGTTDAIEYSIPLSGIGYKCSDTGHSWHANAWYLTKITDRVGNVLYTFQYERGYFVTHASYHVSDTYPYGTTVKDGLYFLTSFSGLSFNNNDFKYYSFTISAPTYLSKICAIDGTEISFKSSKAFPTNRTAYPSLYSRFYKWGNKNSSFFDTEYKTIFGREDCEKRYYYLTNISNVGAQYRYSNDSKEDPFNATGLKCLDSIIVKSNSAITKKIAFIYNDKAPKMHIEELKSSDGNGGNEQTYKFTYNNLKQLPSDYLSTETDDWGYYIEKDSVWVSKHLRDSTFYVSSLKRYITIPINKNYWEYFISYKTKAGTLSEIRYPTGGRDVFEYERNSYSLYLDINRKYIRSENGSCGGFRIKSITTYDAPNSINYSQKKEYVYEYTDGTSSGELASKPIYYYEWHPTNKDKTNMTVKTFSYKSIIPLQSSFGPHVGYSRIVERVNGEETIYTYSNFSNSIKDKPYLSRYQKDITPEDKYGEVGYRRGKILSKTIKNILGKVVYQQLFNYRSDNIENNYVIGCNVEQRVVGLSNSTEFTYAIGGFYQLFYPKFDVKTITERHYKEDGIAYVESLTSFVKKDYDGMRFDSMITKEWNKNKFDSKSVIEKVEYKHAFDLFSKSDNNGHSRSNKEFYYNSDTVFFSKQHFYPLIKTKKYLNNLLVDSVYTRFNLFNGQLLPAYEISGGDTIIQYLSPL